MNQQHANDGAKKSTDAPTRLIRHQGGYAAQGPGFYVWDRDPSEVIRIAEALQTGHAVGSRTARFMVIGGAEPIGV